MIATPYTIYMGKAIHKLSMKDKSTMRGICLNCGPVDLKIKRNVLLCAIGVKQNRGKYPYIRKTDRPYKFYDDMIISHPLNIGNKRYYYWDNKSKAVGITAAFKNKLLEEQNFKCKICERDITNKSYLDHNHINGKFRGLLCINCNTSLGKFNDDVALLHKAIEYLESDNCIVADILKYDDS